MSLCKITVSTGWKMKSRLILLPGFWLSLVITLFYSFCSAACSEITNDPKQSSPVFDIHFVVMTQRDGVDSKTSVLQLQKEVDILNEYFVGENGGHPIKFRYKGQHSVKEMNDSPCSEFLRLGDAEVEFDGDQWSDMFNSCSDLQAVDPSAINFYIYDAYSLKEGFKDKTSHGRNNGNRPFIVFDWERLNHQTQSPEEHEMGHVFGLSHVCVEGATTHTSTNIMASKDCGRGSGGRRNIGFDEGQLSVIQNKAQLISKQLNSQ